MSEGLRMKKVAFIFGVTGQDGFYLAELLLSKNYSVHGLARSLNPLVPEGVVCHHSDLSNMTSIRRTLLDVRPDEVYNLAAQSSVALSFEEAEYTGYVDGLMVTSLLGILREMDPPTRFFQASSMAMFGRSPPPFSEKTPFAPLNPYAAAKLYAHNMCQIYREKYQMFICCGILFHHESPRRGRNFLVRKVSRGVAAILAGKERNLVLGNLNAECDWGDARDFVIGMWKMLQQETPDDYILATGTTRSVQDVVEMCFKMVNLDWKEHVVCDPSLERVEDRSRLSVDVSKAKDTLGWENVTPFEETIRDCLLKDCLEYHAPTDWVNRPLA
jgi:GDPmannose 4,6-dehydratase